MAKMAESNGEDEDEDCGEGDVDDFYDFDG